MPSGGAPALLLVKVGEDGGLVWQRTVSLGASALAVGDLVAARDGRYLVVGATDAAREGSLDLLLVKLSSAGNREWQRTYTLGSGRTEGVTLATSPDGGCLLLGTANATGSSAAVIVKVDTAGNEQWRRPLAPGGAPTRGHALARAGPDGYAVAGEVGSGAGAQSFAARLDRSGAELWNRTLSIGDGPSRALAVAANATGDRLTVGGDASRTAEPLYDLYLASVVPSGPAPNATATPAANATATASPNGTAGATATPAPNASVPATTPAAPLALLAPLAVAGAALVAASRRR
jgi:hypothetical protein